MEGQANALPNSVLSYEQLLKATKFYHRFSARSSTSTIWQGIPPAARVHALRTASRRPRVSTHSPYGATRSSRIACTLPHRGLKYRRQPPRKSATLIHCNSRVFRVQGVAAELAKTAAQTRKTPRSRVNIDWFGKMGHTWLPGAIRWGDSWTVAPGVAVQLPPQPTPQEPVATVDFIQRHSSAWAGRPTQRASAGEECGGQIPAPLFMWAEGARRAAPGRPVGRLFVRGDVGGTQDAKAGYPGKGRGGACCRASGDALGTAAAGRPGRVDDRTGGHRTGDLSGVQSARSTADPPGTVTRADRGAFTGRQPQGLERASQGRHCSPISGRRRLRGGSVSLPITVGRDGHSGAMRQRTDRGGGRVAAKGVVYLACSATSCPSANPTTSLPSSQTRPAMSCGSNCDV